MTKNISMKPSQSEETAPTVLDTFAGAGGFSLGFQQAGYSVIGAIERDKWASDTFAFNHPGVTTVHSDITQLTDERILELFGDNSPDVIIGGPPCQGFSIANRKAGDAKDPRNSLFKEFVRVGRLLRPSVMLMENVPNLAASKTSEGESVLAIIKESLEELGYNTYSTVLQATDYGVPQIRTRLFVLATKFPVEQPFPKATHSIRRDAERSLFDEELEGCPTLWDAISDLPPLLASEGGEALPIESPPLNGYQKMLRGDCEFVFNHKAMNHTKRMVERFASMECGHSVSDVADHLKPRKRNSNEISDRVYDQNNRRMHPDRPCHTIPASFYANFVHPFQHRNFTAREGARIQSFPDGYRFLGKPTVVSHKLLAREDRQEELFLCQYNQIGNAVPPLLAKAIAENIYPKLIGYKNARSRKQSGREEGAQVEVS